MIADTPRKQKIRREPATIDVTCVIGSVVIDDSSPHTVREAAFNLIANHDTDGVFSFPNADGSITSVTVEVTRL